MEARVLELELRFMKLERFAHELSDAVTVQQRTIDALMLEARRVRERTADAEPAPGNDPPPHY